MTTPRDPADDDALVLPVVPDDAPVADTVEQAQPVGPGERVTSAESPLEADGADAAEQRVALELDEDEGRA